MLPRNAVYGIAGLALAGILGGVVALQRYAKLEAETQGPSVVAVGADGAVLLGARQELFLVRSSGTERIALAELGLGGPVVAVGWDGESWFVGDDASGSVHRCDLAARRCSDALAPSAERWLRRTAKLAFAPDRIFVTDTERHRLLAFDAAGRPLAATRTAPIALCFPNGIRVHDDGLLIADTNNHRIAWVDPAADFASETYINAVATPEVKTAQCSDASKHLGARGDAMLNTLVDANTGGRSVARAHGQARGGRVWPSAVERVPTPLGPEVWVIVAADGMRDGDLLAFGVDEGAPRRLPLPADADPVELAWLGDRVLVTDPTNMKVHAVRVGPGDGPAVSTWNPAGLSTAFAAQRAQRAAYRGWRFAATGAIGLGVLLALVVVVLERQRELRQAEAASTAATLMRIDGAAPERISVSRADGALQLEYRWFDERDQRRAQLGYALVGLLALAFLGIELRGFLLGDGDLGELFQAGVLVLVFVLGMGTFNGRTRYRLDHVELAWSTKPIPVLANGRVARGEVAGIRLVSPPKLFGQAAKRGYALELVPRSGRPKRIMQGGEREQTLFVGSTLATALGLDGVAGA